MSLIGDYRSAAEHYMAAWEMSRDSLFLQSAALHSTASTVKNILSAESIDSLNRLRTQEVQAFDLAKSAPYFQGPLSALQSEWLSHGHTSASRPLQDYMERLDDTQ
jgi:hypothetical protein